MMPVKTDQVICNCAIGVSAWIVQECGFHVKPLFAGFHDQFLQDCSGFLQIHSHVSRSTYIIIISYMN